MTITQPESANDQPVQVTLNVLEDGSEGGPDKTLISERLSPPLLKAGGAAMIGSAVVFAVTQAWQLYEASTKLQSTPAKPQHSAVILKDTEASDYADAESWSSKWYQVVLTNSLGATTTKLKFRIRASTMARPPERTPPLRPGFYIPNISVDIDEMMINILQSVDFSVSLTNWECRKPKSLDSGEGSCAAYVELTVTVSSHLLQTWERSFTFAIRGDEKAATLLS